MNVLVTGGAGYVGSHAAKFLKESGHHPVIYDNMSRGHRAVPEILGLPAVIADLRDIETLTRSLKELRIEAVMHFAAWATVGESFEKPLDYYENNFAVVIGLLRAMEGAGVDRFVFSSTCAVYGDPSVVPIVESAPKNPVSPYGRAKLMVERLLADRAASRPAFSYAALRYFNAAGAAMDGTIGEDHRPETHLIPLALAAADGRRGPITIFGDDYPTPDGTPVRDYVHVDDLADAHARALAALEPGTALELNLGTGRGFSVKQIIASVDRVTGHKVPLTRGPRRAGDVPQLYADPGEAKRVLGWTARHTEPDEIISSVWKWMQRNPAGYPRA